MEIDNIFDNIKFKLNPEEDYRKAYKFRFQKGLFNKLSKLANLGKISDLEAEALSKTGLPSATGVISGKNAQLKQVLTLLVLKLRQSLKWLIHH